METYDVIVIGGGASGMMAAIVAAENGANVMLLEKNKRLGEKLRITGGGRCNITNAEDDVRVLLRNYGKAEKYLYSAFSKFGVAESMTFFERLKLPIKVEDRKRAFPVSEKAPDVVHVLQNRLHRLGVTIATKHTVSEIAVSNNTITAVICKHASYTARSYILATGGNSKPETGSTGDGFAWLDKLGHTTKQPTPTITPLAIQEKWVSKIAGVTIENVQLSIVANNVKMAKLNGNVLFTHFGISGPLILNNAYKVSEYLQQGDTVTLTVDFFPGIEAKSLDAHIVTILNNNGAKLLKNTLPQFVPKGLSPAVIDSLADRINFDTKCSEVNKHMRSVLVTMLKNTGLTVEALMGFEKAVVADGGVSLDDVDMRTMQSKKIANLYITGDLLDINRPSGGYSLQLCWTTGFIAGIEASKAVLQ